MAEESNHVRLTVNDSQAIDGPSGHKKDEGESAKLSWKKNPKTLVTIAVSVVVAIAVAIGCIYTVTTTVAPEPGITFPASSSMLGVYRFASVAADAGRCSQIGTQVIARGGSAVDGAIAATICTGAFNMHNAGIGGGFFMTIWDPVTQMGYVVDAREVAPLNSTEDMFDHLGNTSSTSGPYAIAVPGEVAGYWAAHQRFGRVPWSWLFEPTIELCNEGFPVSDVLATAISESINEIAGLENKTLYQTLSDFLINPATQKPYVANDIIHCKQLAKTLKRIASADNGANEFYNGSLARDILADLQEIGSPINETDMAHYEALWRKPIEAMIQNQYRIISTPPPGSGAILSFILNILQGYNFNHASRHDTLTYHRYVEALKFAYAKRTYLGDESFVHDLDGLLANLTSPAYGEAIRMMINDTHTHPTEYYDPDVQNPPRNHGTSHISAIDANGMAAAITSTINTYFGSLIMGSRTGIIFNDEMDDFSSPNETNSFNLPPSKNNFIVPGKRPQSSTCPMVAVVPDPMGDPASNRSLVALVAGAAGGSRITSGVAYIAARVMWFQENVKEAIDALRLHHQLIPDMLYYETGMPQLLRNVLYAKGDKNQTQSNSLSIAQAIQRLPDGTILANSDFRKKIAFPDGF